MLKAYIETNIKPVVCHDKLDKLYGWCSCCAFWRGVGVATGVILALSILL